MYIPRGAISHDGSCQITLAIIRDNSGVDIIERESLACYGIRCDPQTLIFNQPVKITIPHSCLVVNPQQVKPDIVCRVWDSNKDLPITLRKQSSSSPDKPPYCRLYKKCIELYIDRCAEWWVLIPLEQHVIRQQLMCTPYIPDRIERGQEFVVNFQMYNDLPGNEAVTQEESRQQSYHRCHRSFPFCLETKSGDVTITCHREGIALESQIVSLGDLQAKMSHCISLYVPPSEEDLNFAVITITITQAGKLGISRSIAFVIRNTDGPESQIPSEQTNFLRTLEEVKNSDLQSDTDVFAIAQTMDVNQFYDLGIALGFTIAELDRLEYMRFRDRQQAAYYMLVTWRGRQTSTQEAKSTLITLMESFNSSSIDATFQEQLGTMAQPFLQCYAAWVLGGAHGTS
ncbi:uncharacterized protein LOC121416809 [Lytechinus variegatus]|uniref:uncharacterized protein LOC121416809 n=1 Tax=Lytechinus variegatus TaxID=7654 RepID=UPI001BB20F6D|nr:uncharacterized protein LOC121416809 [Lytechinus variegatus]